MMKDSDIDTLSADGAQDTEQIMSSEEMEKAAHDFDTCEICQGFKEHFHSIGKQAADF